MCLRVIEGIGEWKRPKKAWGVFELLEGTVITPCYSYAIDVDEKLKASNHFERDDNGMEYRAGFHKYATEEDAKNSWLFSHTGTYFVCPVYLSGKYTIGIEGDAGKKIYVAEYMTVKKRDLEEAMKGL